MAKRIAFIVAMSVVMVVVCAGTVSCGADARGDNEGASLLVVLRGSGFRGSEAEWADALADEQKAAIDIAYDADVAAGYAGEKDSWISEKVLARHDDNGDIVVMLPDGDEFAVSAYGRGASDGSRQDQAASSSSGREGDASSASAAEAPVRASSSAASQEDAGAALGSSAHNAAADAEGPSASSSDGLSDDGASGPLLTVESAQAHPGDKGVPVAVHIDGNPGILGMTLAVSYDESALTLKSAENGDAFRGVLSMTHSPSLESGCLFMWDGVELGASDVKDGAVLNLVFDVSDQAASGTYPLVVHDGGDAVTNDLHEVSLAIENGYLAVE